MNYDSPTAHSSTTTSPDADTVQALSELAAEVRGLRQDIARLASRRRLAPADAEKGALLLPAITIAAGDRTFVVTELVALAGSSAAGAPALRAALVAAVGPLGAGSGRRLGKLFHRLQSIVIDGYVAQRAGEEAAGIIWSVHRVDGFRW